MKKLIRPTYPKEFSVGLLLLIFIITCFLSQQLFDVSIYDLKQKHDVLVGMFLVSTAIIIMVLIMWEEILFPIKLQEIDGGLLFRNRKSKLRIQLIMYCCMPVIFVYVYLQYDIKLFRFILWAAVCLVPPVLEKIISGVNNYEDFLKLTDSTIEYKNNEKEGAVQIADVLSITILKDEDGIINKIQLLLKNSNTLTIDLDEMELEAFYTSISLFISTRYKHLLNEV